MRGLGEAMVWIARSIRKLDYRGVGLPPHKAEYTISGHMPMTPLPHVNASYINTCYDYKVNNVSIPAYRSYGLANRG